MNFLDNLTREDRELLASLPYRVGLWISQCENAGGEASDEQETRVLESIVDGFAREVFGAETVQYIMMETVANRARWPEWAKIEFTRIPGDCKRAMQILSEHGTEKDVTAFCHHLVEIGEAIAMAFSEYRYASIIDKIRMHYVYYKEAFRASMNKERYKSLHEFLSISKNERAVLGQIADAMGLHYS